MEEIDLKELFYSLWKGKFFIILLAVIGLALGLSYSKFYITPMYKASTSLVLAKGTGLDGSDDSTDSITQSDITLNSKLVSTYGEIIKSRTVAKEVISELNLDMSVKEFISNISVESKKDTELLEITVRNEDSRVAVDIANYLAKAFAAKVADVYNINNVSVIDEAEENILPYNVNHTKNAAIFTCGGLFLACLIIFIKFYFNNTVSSQEDIEKGLGLPVLAVVPKYNEKKK